MTDPSPTEDAPWHPDPLGIVGRVVAGRYRVAGCLTTGGTGAVYIARDGVQEVVLELMIAGESDDAVQRFEREARTLSAIHHPNVVRIHDHGRCADTGLLFVAMDWVRGETLKRHLTLWGPSPLDEFGEIADQILAGVAEAHRHGVIARDLRASNVMISRQRGRIHATLLDFALPAGPEQQQADVYALGALFHQMLTGRRGLHLPMNEALGEDHGVPWEVVALIERCLSEDPALRPHDAWALRRQLDRALSRPGPDRTHLWGGTVLLVLIAVFAATCALLVS